MSNTQSNIILRFLHKRWMWHLAFWCLFFGVTLPSDIRAIYILSDYTAAANMPINLPLMSAHNLVLGVVLNDVMLITFMYSVILVLYPLFFARQHYIQFALAGLLFGFLFDGVHCWALYHIDPILLQPDWLSCFLPMLSTLALLFFMVTTLKFFKDSLIAQERNSEQFRIAKQAELDNLKAQLSPHFLFNTLNNFYGLAVVNSKHLPDLMLRLSDLMRYSLYETHLPFVPLTDEINYLKNYIALEKIRLEDSFELDFLICERTQKTILSANIAPLILIVFVENAFKYSKSIQNEAVIIHIKLTEIANNFFLFYVENPYIKVHIATSEMGNKASGLGLFNVKKRLEALYPNENHKLTIHDDGHHFKISLAIKLA